jgi:hypothetical protein
MTRGMLRTRAVFPVGRFLDWRGLESNNNGSDIRDVARHSESQRTTNARQNKFCGTASRICMRLPRMRTRLAMFIR